MTGSTRCASRPSFASQVATSVLCLAGLLSAILQSPLPLEAVAPADPAAGATLVQAGERLYRSGLGARSDRVRVVVQGDLETDSAAMPCVNCHRRSGWGTVEGTLTTPPVVAPVLFAPVTVGNDALGIRTTGPGTRPPYDTNTLVRALRDGLDPTGRPLSPTMPRYALTPEDARALEAYLRTLGADPPDGITSTTLHLATVVQPGVDARAATAFLETLRAFVRSRNAGTRGETRRRERGPWDMKAHYDVYRTWVLHEWTLNGESASWPAQLDAFYRTQPIFAVLGGFGDDDWAPIHAFCETRHLPCLFPQTAAPPRTANRDFYSVYFSRGLTLEGAALARFTRDRGGSMPAGRLQQVVRCGSPAESAARRLSAWLRLGERSTTCVRGAGELTADAWRARAIGGGTELVAWLAPRDLDGLFTWAGAAADPPARIVLSASLAGEAIDMLPDTLRPRTLVMSEFLEPDRLPSFAARSLVWLNTRGIDRTQSRVAVNALFAATLLGDAMAEPRALASRERLVEQIEHMVGRSAVPSAYPSLTLTSARRFASLGSSVLAVPVTRGGPFSVVGAWAVPDQVEEVP